jgi:RES domain-containing protein
MPRGWRIIKRKFVDHAFDGEGSRLYGSRWTSPGHRVVFAAETLSLAVLEVLVHLQSAVPLADYVTFTVECSERLVEDLGPAALPVNWRDHPAPPAVRHLGDAWLRRGSSGLFRVPSAIIPHEHNFVIDPAHRHFAQLVIEGPVPLDDATSDVKSWLE